MPAKPMPPQKNDQEEPEITQEESVPNDGRDVEGEKLMKEIRNPKLQPEVGDRTAQKTPPVDGA